MVLAFSWFGRWCGLLILICIGAAESLGKNLGIQLAEISWGLEDLKWIPNLLKTESFRASCLVLQPVNN